MRKSGRKKVPKTERNTFRRVKPEPTVMVGFCHPHDSVTPQFRKSLSGVYQYDARSRPRPWIQGEYDHEVSGVHVPDARCAIVEDFLASEQAEWLWMVDADATFAPDTLDKFMAVADPETHPIVGALAFGVRPMIDPDGVEVMSECFAPTLELFPTIYTLDEQDRHVIWWDYPRDQLVEVLSTGAHCFVVHRSVLEHEAWRAMGHPLPWFRTEVWAHEGASPQVLSEDQFFFLSARALGFPVFVHTGIKTGHVKTFVADERLFLAGRTDG